ncbi:MAG: retropepsin-like aspartic protease [Thermoleophilaceae bacterium]
MVDVWLEGIEVAALGCLVDTGAMRTRFSRDLATAAGIEIDESQSETFAIGGQVVEGAPAHVGLRLGDADDGRTWEASVWFCDPWPFAFQLLGLDGFLRHFRTTVSAYHEWVDCQPEG